MTFTGLDKHIFFSVQWSLFSYPSFLTYVLGAQKNRLTETVLLSTHNISGTVLSSIQNIYFG